MRTDPAELAERLEAALLDPVFTPRYNIAPTQGVLAAVNNECRTVAPLRWGLVPPWSDPAKMKLTTFNARVETIATSRVYSAPLRWKRCAIFADGYYEWRKNADGSKTPFWIARCDGRPFVFAGLWDERTDGAAGETMRSCTIITQPANEFLEPIHSRMPVVLDDERARAWLTVGKRESSAMLELLVPMSADDWTAHPVSPAVGNVRTQGEDLIQRRMAI